jgi:hypothetical protein
MSLMAKSKKSKSNKTAGIGDEAVLKATGKTWSQWGKLLDADGCKKMAHKEIAEIVHVKHGVKPWWSQMVTVGYEQMRGLRKPHETSRGWQVGVSRTMNVPIGTLYGAWADSAVRRKWMGSRKLTVRKATHNKSLRIACGDDTSLEVNFYSKGTAKSQVALQQNKLKSAKDVTTSKKFWSAAMDKLKKQLGA